MERTDTPGSFREGDEVYGADGDKVGTIVEVQPTYFVVEKGIFFPTDYYLPLSAVASSDRGKVYLRVTKDEALNQGWDADSTGYDEAIAIAGEDVNVATTAAAGTVDLGSSADVARRDAGRDVAADTTTTETRRVEGTDTIRVPVHEEEVTATTRQRQVGEVGVEKRVVAEERTIEVPVTEERARVRRRAVDRPVGAGDTTVFEEGTIAVPIQGEEVRLQKTTRVTEEVKVGKEAVQRTEQATGTVRREEVRVRERTNGDTAAAARRAALRDMQETRDTTDDVDEPDDPRDRVR